MIAELFFLGDHSDRSDHMKTTLKSSEPEKNKKWSAGRKPGMGVVHLTSFIGSINITTPCMHDFGTLASHFVQTGENIALGICEFRQSYF